jgi:ankyrin repeat protein
MASREGHSEIVKLLLEKRANPNIQNDFGKTALMEALEWMGNTDIVNLLLENGADPNIRDRHGETAYDLAIKDGNIEIIKLLKYYTMMYNMQRRRRRNLTYRKKRTQLAHKNLALSKLIDTYDVDEPLTRDMRRETIRSIFGY